MSIYWQMTVHVIVNLIGIQKSNIVNNIRVMGDILGVLRRYRSSALALHNDKVGLCQNIYNWTDERDIDSTDAILKPIFKTWEYFSGCLTYPVPESDGKCPIGSYLNNRFLYKGEQGEYRNSLMGHIINEIRKGIK